MRLTAEDGYQAQRSYSLAAPADDERVVITVEELEDGEVSPFLTRELRPGDRFELRGPIGGYFVWDGSSDGPLQLVAGGSGIVPLMAMLRHRAAAEQSSAGVAPLLRPDARGRHLPGGARPPRGRRSGARGCVHAHAGTAGRLGGLRAADRLGDAGGGRSASPKPDATAYVCGATRFVEVAADGLVGLGYDPSRVRTERFGPT